MDGEIPMDQICLGHPSSMLTSKLSTLSTNYLAWVSNGDDNAVDGLFGAFSDLGNMQS